VADTKNWLDGDFVFVKWSPSTDRDRPFRVMAGFEGDGSVTFAHIELC